MATLHITIRNNPDETFDGFPYLAGQIVINTSGSLIEIDLGERTDTTSHQEQFLNTCPAVINYSVDQVKV